MDRFSGRRTRPHALVRPTRYRVSGLPKSDMRWVGTNSYVICVASRGITSTAVQFARGGIVRCKDCFAEVTLGEGLVDDETESGVVRPRGYFE
jgi:hypothetical protein